MVKFSTVLYIPLVVNILSETKNLPDMKKLPIILIVAVLAAVAVILYVRNNNSDKYQIVTVKGADLFSKFADYPEIVLLGNNPAWVSALPLIDNDLLVLMFKDNAKNTAFGEEEFYKFSKKDGSNLTFRKQGFKMYLNDQLISINISKDSTVLDWLNSATPEETAHLRHLVISESLSSDCLEGLKKLAGKRPDLSLIFNVDGSVKADEILKVFSPQWLFGGFELTDKGMERLYSLTGLELLFMDQSNLDLERFPRLVNLKSLMINDFKPSKDGKKLNLPDNLQKLTIMQSSIKNLEFLGTARGLKELTLVSCDSLRDISALSGFTAITSVGFAQCKSLTDLNPLNTLSRLERFTFPPKVSNQEFLKFIETHNQLKTIELLGCSYITDPEPLLTLPNLSCLSVISDTITADRFFSFKKLDYLTFGGYHSDDTVQIAANNEELKKNLPNTIVVPSAGLCLGTGWVLLLIPLLIVFGLVKRKKEEW